MTIVSLKYFSLYQSLFLCTCCIYQLKNYVIPGGSMNIESGNNNAV